MDGTPPDLPNLPNLPPHSTMPLMNDLSGKRRSREIKSMFGRIARRYDLLNRLITLGQDIHWRREVVRRLEAAPKARLLDLGTGTGDLAIEALHQVKNARLVGADFTPEMIAVGRHRRAAAGVNWVLGDALHLPFASGSFEGVVSGFLMRNVTNLPQALAEQWRILRPGSPVVCLDTTPPPPGWLHPFLSFYLHSVIPALGQLLAGDRGAYRYLPDSTEAFLGAEPLRDQMRLCGFERLGFVRHMFGTIAIHWGRKPAASDEGNHESQPKSG
jgi:demethylmenaquinone methyltransferase/2-methoxy-6-polyprenyl-1,4-benzoquinol methylase